MELINTELHNGRHLVDLGLERDVFQCKRPLTEGTLREGHGTVPYIVDSFLVNIARADADPWLPIAVSDNFICSQYKLSEMVGLARRRDLFWDSTRRA